MKQEYIKIQYLKELRDDYYRIKKYSDNRKTTLKNRVRLEFIENEFKKNRVKL